MKSQKISSTAKWITISCAIFLLAGCKKSSPAEDMQQVQSKSEQSTPKASHASADVVFDWYKLQLRFLLERNSTLNGTHFGYIGVGLYEAVRHGIKNSVSLSTKLYQMPDMPAKENNNGYNWSVSANAALAKLLRYYNVGLTPANIASMDSLENAYNEKLGPSVQSESFARSQTFGRSIATAVYNWSLTDNFNPSNIGYVPPVFPGSWVPTPPAFANGINPFYSAARPFLESNLSVLAPPFVAPYSEDPNSDFYKIVMNDYVVSQGLTQAQKDIAMFWVDQGNGVGFTPPGHDFSFVLQALQNANVDLGLAAEAFAKVGIAERDAMIEVFKSKYTYNLLRPVTYIRKLIDPNWLPFIPTPPHPEYPAAHAFVTGSVMQALTEVLGDHVSVTDHTYDFRGWTPRTFSSIFAAAEEAGISRLYGGIHYLPSINVGLAFGHIIGRRAGELQLHGGD
jgi:hypothetical protein